MIRLIKSPVHVIHLFRGRERMVRQRPLLQNEKLARPRIMYNKKSSHLPTIHHTAVLNAD